MFVFKGTFMHFNTYFFCTVLSICIEHHHKQSHTLGLNDFPPNHMNYQIQGVGGSSFFPHEACCVTHSDRQQQIESLVGADPDLEVMETDKGPISFELKVSLTVK